jgi:hypothetical protein
VAAALLAVAWLGFGYRSVSLQSKALAVAAGDKVISPAELSEARDLLDKSRFLNADQIASIDEALLLGRAAHYDQAGALGERIVDKEPDNYSGWFFVYAFSPSNARRVEAYRELRLLDPQVAAHLVPPKRSGS